MHISRHTRKLHASRWHCNGVLWWFLPDVACRLWRDTSKWGWCLLLSIKAMSACWSTASYHKYACSFVWQYIGWNVCQCPAEDWRGEIPISFSRHQEVASFQVMKSFTNQSVVAYPAEFLNSLEPSGMPPHILNLKIGVPIMVFQNVNSQTSAMAQGALWRNLCAFAFKWQLPQGLYNIIAQDKIFPGSDCYAYAQ